ncbi:MAG TPA: c-type cytochrome domain-containing protein, partial [Phycisphaerales bacterium]|nr:c-type cytochrome domain-containing protein [Phycisphaerales bacterium]
MKRSEDPNRHAPSRPVLLGAALLASVSIAAAAAVATMASAGREMAGDAPARPSKIAVHYDRDIRQILSDRCSKCHGPDAKARQADLRLDDRESALRTRDGVTPIVPGDIEASELWRRINSDDPLVRMPPPDSNKKPLSAEERELIGEWIRQGAEYEPHWSFVPPVRPPLPEVSDSRWCRNNIDRYILANLESHGAKPSPEADKATLLRRVMLDLTGLPPTLEELDAFEA